MDFPPVPLWLVKSPPWSMNCKGENKELMAFFMMWKGTDVWDDTVELAASVPESVLASGQLTEVARGSGDCVVEEFEYDAP
jgi:hypothetical protein